MRQQTRARLLEVNRRFYQTFAVEFSDSRRQPLPGVQRWVERVDSKANVLDLGCGNGSLAASLAAGGHLGRYLGVDASTALLELARANAAHPAASWTQIDLASPDWRGHIEGKWTWVFCLATLHHLPGAAERIAWAREAATLLKDEGWLAISVWNLADEPDWEDRLLPWRSIGLSEEDVEVGDALVDWRRGGRGQRYVHLFQDGELQALAQAAGFQVESTDFAGGQGGRLNRLQLWRLRASDNGEHTRMVESGGSGG